MRRTRPKILGSKEKTTRQKEITDFTKKNSSEQTLTESLPLNVLEGWLFEAANKLRGPVDAADFKTYIFPLLFFKRICDVYDEIFKERMQKSGGDVEEALFRENYQFFIPEGCHWNDVRQQTQNVGQALAFALRGIERENQSTLYGIFGDAQWANKQRLSDALLIDLIEHFSIHNLSNSDVEPDVAGRAYEYLIKKFADEANKAAGEFYTPRSVVHLIIRMLKPSEGESVYDPACGTGGMLLEAFHYVKERGGNVNTLRLYGQEKNLTTSSIARMNLFLHGLEDFKIIRGDTLRSPKFFEGDSLSTFDCVIANPPFSLKNWGEEVWEKDPWGRNFAGIPPRSYGDYAWVQHMISSMASPNGRMGVILPEGALFRKGSENRIRKILIERDLLDTVIQLAPNVFYGTPLAACILIFRSRKDNKRRGKVLFINALEQFWRGKNQNELHPRHVDTIFGWYKSYKNRVGFTRITSIEEIRENDFNLNVSLYVEPIIDEYNMTAQEALKVIKKAGKDCQKAERRLKTILWKMDVGL